MRVFVYGLGRSGTAAAELAARQGHHVLAYDAHPRSEEVARLTAVGGTLLDAPEAALEHGAALCIAAPGVPWDHPDLEKLRARGLETIGEVEWVSRTVDAPIVGVTGTAGKTSATRALAAVLQHAGLDAVAGGNVDPALAAVATPGRLLVAELSSFQLERCPTLKPQVAVTLNLGVDHLDRHGSVAAYHATKFRITANQTPDDVLIVNADDTALSSWAARTRATVRRFSVQGTADAHLRGEWLELGGARLVRRDALRVTGTHQLGNLLAVALAAEALGLSRDAIAAGLAQVEPTPGRFSVVANVDGATFIEDSIATRTLAVAAALDAAAPPIVWLAGGVDKGAELAPLEPLVTEKVSLMIGLGAAGPQFTRHYAPFTKTRVIAEPDGEAALVEACTLALEHLRDAHGGRGTVLLAPLGASFDQFPNYQARGAAFRRAVAALTPAGVVA